MKVVGAVRTLTFVEARRGMEQYERRAGVLSQQLNSARGIKKRTIAIYIFVNFARRIALAYVIASTDLNYLG